MKDNWDGKEQSGQGVGNEPAKCRQIYGNQHQNNQQSDDDEAAQDLHSPGTLQEHQHAKDDQGDKYNVYEVQ